MRMHLLPTSVIKKVHKMPNKASQRDSQTAARFVCPCWRRYVDVRYEEIYSIFYHAISNFGSRGR